MEYKTLGQLAGEAEVSREPVLATTPMTKRERLERWAILLEREPDRRLSSVQEVEYGTRSEREGKRADDFGPRGGVRRSGAARPRPGQRSGGRRGRLLRAVALGDPSGGLLVPLRPLDVGRHRRHARARHRPAATSRTMPHAGLIAAGISAAAVALVIAIL